MKPKNDGQVLQIRVSTGTHEKMALVLAKWAAEGKVPSERTKGRVVEVAVEALWKQVEAYGV